MPLFESKNIQVDYVAPFRSDFTLVSFAERKMHEPDLAEQGFGQDFARKIGLDGFYVKCAGNHWYQYPEMSEAIAAIRKAGEGLELVTYGSSMGAYAAIKFAGALGAKRAVAISPLFSPDPSKPPFEPRWRADADRIKFIDDAIPVSPATDIYILSDPAHADTKHARLFRAKLANLTTISVPLAIHPVSHFLRESEILSDTIANLLKGTFDNKAWCARRRRVRMQSEIYRKRLAEVLQERASRHERTALFHAPS